MGEREREKEREREREKEKERERERERERDRNRNRDRDRQREANGGPSHGREIALRAISAGVLPRRSAQLGPCGRRAGGSRRWCGRRR